jgi:arsenite oxidase small subunit
VRQGVGPQKDIVAFSLKCPHQGFPLALDEKTMTLKCPGHFSQFDAEMGGQMICGQATAKLARIVLECDEHGKNIRAVGIDGLIYGRVQNYLT